MSKAGATRPYPLRIPEKLLDLAETKSRDEKTDRSTALRRLLYAGAEEYVLDLLSEGRISAGRAAEVLDVSTHRIHQLARKHSVEIGATPEQYHSTRQDAAGLLE